MMSENEREEYEKSEEYLNNLRDARKELERHFELVLSKDPLQLRSVISIATHNDVDPIGDPRINSCAVLMGATDRMVDAILDCVEELVKKDKAAIPLLLAGVLQRRDHAIKKMAGEAVPNNKLNDEEAKNAVNQAMKNMFDFANKK